GGRCERGEDSGAIHVFVVMVPDPSRSSAELSRGTQMCGRCRRYRSARGAPSLDACAGGLGRVLIDPLSVSAAQSMSASLGKRPKCCVAANMGMCQTRTHAPQQTARRGPACDSVATIEPASAAFAVGRFGSRPVERPFYKFD